MASTASEPKGTLATALAHAARLLAADPALAEVQSREILKVVPDHPEALWLLGAALRGQRRGPEAIEALRRATALDPARPQAWRDLGDELTLAGDTAGADVAYARQIKASVHDPVLIEAAGALCDNRLAVAERILRGFLKTHPTDVAALRMLAEIGTRIGRYEDAERLLARCLELAPGFTAARHNYAIVLYRQSKGAEAVAQAARLLAEDPRNPSYRVLKAAALGRVGDYAQAIRDYETVLQDHPDQPKAWMSYGHALKTVGRGADSIAAYRRTIALLPGLGEAWWSLANLKTLRFSKADIDQMLAQLDRADLGDEDRLHLHFALGKALEDEARFEDSFAHYLKANTLRRATLDYDPEETTRHLERSKAVFTPAFFAARTGVGCDAPDPIFILGLPRTSSS